MPHYLNRSFVSLISIAVLLGLVSNAWSLDKDWTNAAGDHLWRTAANWSGGIPTSVDKAGIRNNFAVNGPIIDSSTVAEANQIVLGDWASSSDSLEMTGGTLAVHEWFILGYYAINSGTFTVTGGIASSGSFCVGFYGTGTLNMIGGTVNVGGTFSVAQQTGGTGNVHLDSGTISCGGLNMTSGGRIDITAGTLIVNNDVRTTINGYISSGWITAYGGAGTVNVDYNVTNPGKTTLMANTTPPAKATNPDPPTGAAGILIDATLSWTPAPNAASHDVYFGTASPGTFRGNQTTATFDPGTLVKNAIYYWRIDEKNENGTTTGDVWSFTTVSTGDYFVGTYYYPWYHNNNFHGSGSKGSNSLMYYLDPQMTPQLGWYDQNDADISQHFKWARYAGINLFINSYWGMNTVEDHVQRYHMFNNPDRGDIKLAVFLEPSLTPVDHAVTPESLTNQTNFLCDNYFNRPGYMRIDNKPVIFIYVTRAMTDPNLEMCISTIRTAASNKGIGEVYIVGDEVWGWPDTSSRGISRVSQMDAVTNYDVYGNLNSQPFVTDSVLDNWQVRNAAWKEFVNSLGKQFIPAVSPGFNDRGVREGHNPCSRKLNNESYAFGTLFSAMLDRVGESVDTGDMIIVTSWNEWHEDTQIEPAAPAPATNLDISGTQYYTGGLYYNGYGMLYLDILRDKTTMLALCDYDSNGTVGFDDLAFVLDYWLDSCGIGNDCIEADLNSSGTVSLADFASCARDWTGNN